MMGYKGTKITPDGTHHIKDGEPLYGRRFHNVQSFHESGIAAVVDESGAYHIGLDGKELYDERYKKTYGFYDGFAAVEDDNGWYHINKDYEPVYPERYDWVGNFQEGRCTVRNEFGEYFHINLEGKQVYLEKYLYAGDYRHGIAVVRQENGLCIHINNHGKKINDAEFVDLDVFHKGKARARIPDGWTHVDKTGFPAHEYLFERVEPFYNNQALCNMFNGNIVLIDETRKSIKKICKSPKMKMKTGPKILLIGTLGCGKTFIAKRIQRELDLEYISIDDCRIQFGDNSFFGEYKAWAHFLSKCEMPSGTILEFSGGGPHVHAVKTALLKSKMNIFVIWLDPSIEVCIFRAKRRDKQIPTPYPWGEIEKSVEEIRASIKNAFNNIWDNEKDIRTLKINNTENLAIRGIINFLEGE